MLENRQNAAQSYREREREREREGEREEASFVMTSARKAKQELKLPTNS